MGRGVKPRGPARGLYGNARVMAITSNVIPSMALLGLLRKNGSLCVPQRPPEPQNQLDKPTGVEDDRNCLHNPQRIAKVAKSNNELSGPKTIINRRMKPISQRRGFSIMTSSTLSPAIIISGRSVVKLISRICWEAWAEMEGKGKPRQR